MPFDAVKIFQEQVVPVLFRLLGAAAIWMIGRRLITFAMSLITKALQRNKMDPTLVRYLGSIVSSLLTLFLALGIIEFLGIPTTSFAALAAGAGLAIGAAWSGLLANFAAGIFMIVMRPFQVGDFITAAGVTGTVKEIGLFVTQIDTEDNIQTLVGNGKIFGDNVQNHTARPKRTCKVEFQLKADADFAPRMPELTSAIAAIPGASDADVDFEKFTPWGPVLSAQAGCSVADFRRVRAGIAAEAVRVYGAMGLGGAPGTPD
jgi:small conductance mechanosensitive channel